MKNVALLCIIFLPVLLIAVNLNGNLFDYSNELGNKAVSSIQEITEKVSIVTNKTTDFMTNPDENPFSKNGGIIGWMIGDKSTVTEHTVSKVDFLAALVWEYDNSTISIWRYMALYAKYTFKSKDFYIINDDITFDLDNPYIYPSE